MASLNKVILIGNLGKDPDVKSFPDGGRIAAISIATTDKWKDKNSGEMKESTEWHRIVFNGRLAEIAEQYLKKGIQIYVEGSLKSRKWTDKDGVEKSITEIKADSMQILTPKGSSSGGSSSSGSNSGGNSRQGADDGYSSNGYAAATGRSMPRSAPPAAPRAPAPAQAAAGFDDMDDDIPF